MPASGRATRKTREATAWAARRAARGGHRAHDVAPENQAQRDAHEERHEQLERTPGRLVGEDRIECEQQGRVEGGAEERPEKRTVEAFAQVLPAGGEHRERQEHEDELREGEEVREGEVGREAAAGAGRGGVSAEEPLEVLPPRVDVPVGALRGGGVADGASEVVDGRGDKGVVDARPVLAERREEEDGGEEEAERGEDDVLDVGARDVRRVVPEAEDAERPQSAEREPGGGEGEEAGCLGREGEPGADAEEKRPGARLEAARRRNVRTEGPPVADAGPEHHQGKTGQQHLLDEVRREEREERRGADEEDGHERAQPGTGEPEDGVGEEDEAEDGEEEGRAAEERAVEVGGRRMAERALERGGGVVERGTVVVRGPVRVVPRLQEPSDGERLVRLVGMERA